MSIHYDIVVGDRVIWRQDGDEWTVDKIRYGQPMPVLLKHRSLGGFGPIEVARANPGDLVRLGKPRRRDDDKCAYRQSQNQSQKRS